MQPDTPARAVRCATSIVDGMRSLDLQVRGGIHTGKIEIKGDDIAGIAVHIAARVAALAAGGQVLVSSTVRDLVAGSNLRFADQGCARVERDTSEGAALLGSGRKRRAIRMAAL
jgi:class 3 adenylate cyclase